MQLQGAVVIITGASEGIGQATAELFAQKHARLALAARTVKALQQVAATVEAAGAEALVIPTDMRQPDQIRHLVQATRDHFGRIDILINNAGQAVGGAVAEVNAAQFQSVIDLNIFGPLHAMQAVIPIMREQGGGLIINVSSMVSQMAIPTIGAYAATKAALNKLTETARGELAPDNIRVITVYPRLTATKFGVHYLRDPDAAPRPARSGMPQADTAEHVASKILLAAEQEPEEQYME